jgi:RimJ/RimL family protein N-acetyltransferase
MISENGKTISFRLATREDAEFIHSLRIDPHYNIHLSPVSDSITDQEKWLDDYKIRESRCEEYYFIILNNSTNERMGTVRLYDFKNEKSSFSWGSWILNASKTRYAAVESAMLVYQIGFKDLGFRACHFEVRKENLGVIQFHKRLGAEIIGEDEFNFYFNLIPDVYSEFYKSNKKYISTGDE